MCSGSDNFVVNAFNAKTAGEANQSSLMFFWNVSIEIGGSWPPVCILMLDAGRFRRANMSATWNTTAYINLRSGTGKMLGGSHNI